MIKEGATYLWHKGAGVEKYFEKSLAARVRNHPFRALLAVAAITWGVEGWTRNQEDHLRQKLDEISQPFGNQIDKAFEFYIKTPANEDTWNRFGKPINEATNLIGQTINEASYPIGKALGIKQEIAPAAPTKAPAKPTPKPTTK